MAETDDASPPAAAQCAASSATARPSARRTGGSGRPGRWREYHDQVRDLALGLAALGFRRGRPPVGHRRQPAAPVLGAGGRPVPRAACSVPVYQDSIAKELAFVWNHAEVSVIVAEDQEQVDKILALKDQLPALTLVVYDDSRGMAAVPARLAQVATSEVQEAGRTFGARASRATSRPRSTRAGRRTSPSSAYTSGTTGTPKGAMITHANAIVVAETRSRKARTSRRRTTSLAYLPMAWAGDSRLHAVR